MALLRALPNELFVRIARSLIGRRIDHFDPVAIKDLQSFRLVSQRVSHVTTRLHHTSLGGGTTKLNNTFSQFNAAAIPTLFENMVLDFSSFKLDDMRRFDFLE